MPFSFISSANALIFLTKYPYLF
ncbi:hypothetical protein ACVB78_04390, partial [Priestia aryabhattai]